MRDEVSLCKGLPWILVFHGCPWFPVACTYVLFQILLQSCCFQQQNWVPASQLVPKTCELRGYLRTAVFTFIVDMRLLDCSSCTRANQIPKEVHQRWFPSARECAPYRTPITHPNPVSCLTIMPDHNVGLRRIQSSCPWFQE